jgi:ABC-2 type transport system ATP-binding protein
VAAVISVEDVSKQFRLYHERYFTLKERLVHFGRQQYEPFWALRDVSLTVEDGETLGLMGANGSGKTTLLKIVAGILRPTSGVVRTRGRVAALLELGAGFHTDLTGRENIYLNGSILGLSRREVDRSFDDIVDFSELEPFIDMQVKHYSSGMYARLGFAVAVHVDPQVLLVDEVLAVGDEAFALKCLDRVRQFQKEGRTIVLVTHALDQIREICGRAACLDHGGLAALGEPSEVVQRFRQILHGDGIPETPAAQEVGTGEMRILSVVFEDGQSQKRQVFNPGEDIGIVIDVEAQRPVSNPAIGIAIYDERDTEVFATDTDKRQIAVGLVGGKIRSRFTLKRIPFSRGTYSVSVNVQSNDGRTIYHRQEKAYRFRCVYSGQESGPIHIPCEIDIEHL